MNKLLLGTMLMAQTINPYNQIVNGTNNYQSYYNNGNWTITQNDADAYVKNKLVKAETIENDLVKIESTCTTVYGNDKEAQMQFIDAINVVRITPKGDITDYTIRISSFYSQEPLQYTEFQSELKYYRAEGTLTPNFYATQFLNMTTYDQTIVWNFTNVNNGIMTQQNLQETWTAQEYGEDIIEIFANPEEIQYMGSQTTPMIYVYYLSYVLDYDIDEYPKGVWQNETNFLYGKPGALSGYYKWTVDTDTIDNIEIVDIPGLLFTILGMPFAFISQAFNLTIFPGNPLYEVNLSHIFLALIVAGIIIFIIKKVFK